MSKRLVSALLITLCATFASGAIASAQSSGSNIWNGLWEGASLTDTTTNESTPRSSSSPKTSNKPSQQSSNTYAALGDSVAAGLGLSGGTGQCGRTTQAYPFKVNQSLNLRLVHAACSGATAGDLVTKQSVSGPNVTAQLDTAFASGTPKLISITAGANDVHWNDYFLWKCYNSTCGTDFDNTVSDAYLRVLRAKLHYAFNDISWRSNGQEPRVIVTGYYDPLSKRCASQQQRVTSSEITWLRSRLATLNRTIRDVSQQYSYVTFAPVSFAGHDICSTEPWVQGPNDPAPFHPNAAGQAVIAESVLRAY